MNDHATTTDDPTAARYSTLEQAAAAAEAEPELHEAALFDDAADDDAPPHYRIIATSQIHEWPDAEHNRIRYTPNPSHHYAPWTTEHANYTPAQEHAYQAAYVATYRQVYSAVLPGYPPQADGRPYLRRGDHWESDHPPATAAHAAATEAARHAAEQTDA